MWSITLRFEERPDRPIAVEQAGRIAAAIEPEVVRIERLDPASEEIDRSVLAQIFLASPQQFTPNTVPSLRWANCQHADDAVRAIKVRLIGVRSESGMAESEWNAVFTD